VLQVGAQNHSITASPVSDAPSSEEPPRTGAENRSADGVDRAPGGTVVAESNDDDPPHDARTAAVSATDRIVRILSPVVTPSR